MSPRSLSLAGKIWSDVIGSAESRFAGQTCDAVRVRGTGPLPGPATNERWQLHVRLRQYERTGLSNISRLMLLSPGERLN